MIDRDIITRLNKYILFGFLFFAGLHFAKPFLVTFTFAAMFAMLMLPVANWLEEKGTSRGIAAAISVFITLVVLAGLFLLIFQQLSSFSKDIPGLKDKLLEAQTQVQQFIAQSFNIPVERQQSIIKDQSGSMMTSLASFVKSTLLGIGRIAIELGLFIIYMFFMLFLRGRFTNFMLKITPRDQDRKAMYIAKNVTHVMSKYLMGKLVVMIILAVMNSIGLSIIGVRHPILFGGLAAILDIIPYIGVFIGGLLPTLFALITMDIKAALAVVIVFSAIQFIQNNFLIPWIVGSSVELNPLSTIVAIVIGGLLWGVAGMILFIPLLGVLMVIFKNIDSLYPYSYLLGERQSSSHKKPFFQRVKRWFKGGED